MTGLELKIWLLVLTVLVFAPVFFLALLRTELTCDSEVPAVTGWFWLFCTAFLAAIPIFVFFIFIVWKDESPVAFMLGYAAIPTAASTIHGLSVLTLMKAAGWWVKPRVSSICGELCIQIYFVSAALWFALFTKKIDLTTWAQQIIK